MHEDGVGTGITVQKSAGNDGVEMENNMMGMGRGWGRYMRGRMGTGTGLAGWGGDGDDFHPRACNH